MSTDWNADVYHRVSEPQFQWGMAVLDRLVLAGRERVLDVGCGTGRLTMEIARRLRGGAVTGTDRSATMLETASGLVFDAGVALVRADAAQLPFAEAFDVVFSTATFHWVLDHDALFSSLFQALRPGGRLHAQCGGGPNLARVRARANRLLASPPFAPYFSALWHEPWNYANPEDTAVRLRQAGFGSVETSLQPAPVAFDCEESFQIFTDHVILRPYLSLLPDALQRAFSAAIAEQAASDTPPFTLDYWRLNLTARRPHRKG